jgi:hypothetical protein
VHGGHDARVGRGQLHEEVDHRRALLGGERRVLVAARVHRAQRDRVVLLPPHGERVALDHLRAHQALHAAPHGVAAASRSAVAIPVLAAPAASRATTACSTRSTLTVASSLNVAASW